MTPLGVIGVVGSKWGPLERRRVGRSVVQEAVIHTIGAAAPIACRILNTAAMAAPAETHARSTRAWRGSFRARGLFARSLAHILNEDFKASFTQQLVFRPKQQGARITGNPVFTLYFCGVIKRNTRGTGLLASRHTQAGGKNLKELAKRHLADSTLNFPCYAVCQR